MTDRLTEREKQALRGWLDHKTAKEIALDLGISHHAVEKRLKMARTKLEVGSSLEAARLLAEVEGYGRAVSGPPDLHAPAKARQPWQHPTTISGAIAMLIASALVFAVMSSSQSAQTAEIVLKPDREAVFALLDVDKSGYLENPESPFVKGFFLDSEIPEGAEGEFKLGDSSDPDQVAEFYADADADQDERVSFREFSAWHEARLAELGIDFRAVLRVERQPES